MNLSLVSYNGTNINDGTTYLAYIDQSQDMGQPPVEATYVQRAGAWPLYSGKTFRQTIFGIKIDCSPGAPASSGWLAKFEDLNQLFNNEDETPRLLVVKDTDNADKQYFIYCVPTGQPTYGDEGPVYSVRLAFDHPVWQSSTDNTQTFATTSSTDSTSVTVNGNADSYPTFAVTATSTPSTDYGYSVFLQVLPTSANPWVARPLNLTSTTDATFDTAALVAAGKMQADGDDLRVFRDGVEIDRWLNGINTTDTHVWVVADMPTARNMTLKTALGAGTETEIVLNYTTANKTAIKALPDRGRLIIDSSLGSTDTEEFTYTARVVTSSVLKFTIGTRAVRGTSAIAHAANANVRFLPYDFTIVYGNPNASAPDVDDTRKPIISLASENWQFIYSNFYDNAALRAGIWAPDVIAVSNAVLTNSKTFTSTNDEGDTDPATAMGLSAESYRSSGIWKADAVKIEWRGHFPDFAASVASVSGAQIQTIAGVPVFVLQSSTGGDWYTRTTVAVQASTDYSTWTAWTKSTSDVTLPAGTIRLRFYFSGTIAGSTDNYRKGAVEAITVNLTNYPRVKIGSENVNMSLDFTLRNITTGEAMTIVLPIELNIPVTIDTDPDFPTVKYRNSIMNGALRLDSTRAAWLKLQPGANTLGYETNKSAANDISIVITWKDRLIYL